LEPWLQQSTLKILLCCPVHTVAGFKHLPPQNTSFDAQPHEHVAVLKTNPLEQVFETHVWDPAAPQATVPLGQTQLQVESNTRPPEQGVAHVPLQATVPVPQSHPQVVVLRTVPVAQTGTH